MQLSNWLVLRSRSVMDCNEISRLKSDEAVKEEGSRENEVKEGARNNLVDASCQTDFVVINFDLPELKRRMDLSQPNDPESLTTESITAAAQYALNRSGWVYDQKTGTYFDYNTNLYYYPQTRLYYNYKNGCYYKYNQETQKYEFHYQLEGFKNRKKNERQKNGNVTRKNKQMTLPTLRKFEIQLWNERDSDSKTKQINIDMDLSSANTQSKEFSSLLFHKATFTRISSHGDHLSDSENLCMAKRGRKYHLCKKCSKLITNSCCLNRISACSQTRDSQPLYCSDSEIEMLSAHLTKYCHCKTCNSLTLSACCNRVDFWLSKATHPKALRRKRGGRKRRRKRKRHSEQSSDSSLNSTPSPATSRNSQFQEENQLNVNMQGTLERSKLEYNFSVDTLDGEMQSDMEAEHNVIPCIRAMVTSSQSLKIGELYLITCNGAVFGSADQCDVQILEEGVSRRHATITYNAEQRNYFVTDLGSESGSTLNSTTECNPGTKTVLATPISHKSILIIGSCIFVLHLHHGHETCNDCEPGQIQALLGQEQPSKVYVLSKQDKEAVRRSELKSLKKKYDLQGEQYKHKECTIGTCYTDRAAERRRTVGSDNPYEKDEIPTSLEKELGEQNKGHQMMKKMGWNKGASLGKSQKGIIEPIKPQGSGKGKLGLGFGAFSLDNS